MEDKFINLPREIHFQKCPFTQPLPIITINCVDINHDLCNILFRHNIWYINKIPTQYISREMISAVMNYHPAHLLSVDIPGEYMTETIERMVELDHTILLNLNRTQLASISFEVFRKTIAKYPSLITAVPDGIRNRVFESQSPDFYNELTLRKFRDLTLCGHIYKKYFHRVPLYYLTDIDDNTLGECKIIFFDEIITYKIHPRSVTWDPDEFNRHSNWVPYYIYDVEIPDDIMITIHGHIRTISSRDNLIINSKRKYVAF
jgi:hypothetical protein